MKEWGVAIAEETTSPGTLAFYTLSGFFLLPSTGKTYFL